MACGTDVFLSFLHSKGKKPSCKILLSWIENEKSNIVRVMSLQTLADFARQDGKIKNKVMPILKEFVVSESPSLKSRSKRLLKEFAAKDYVPVNE